MSEFYHVSVLLQECLDGLNIKPDGIYVDGTLGGAGHSSQIAKRLTTGRLIGIDRDPVALAAAGERLKPYGDRVTLVHSNFCEISNVLDDLGIEAVDGILLDLGVSSPQLDDSTRGFSYMADAPLDMRMNGTDAGLPSGLRRAPVWKGRRRKDAVLPHDKPRRAHRRHRNNHGLEADGNRGLHNWKHQLRARD